MNLIIILLVVLEIEVLALIALSVTKKRRRARMQRPSFIDTSVLIDGRIIAAAQTGFIPTELVVPKSVIAELQLLADGSDSDKRFRARHGLDIVAELQAMEHLQVTILDDGKAVDGVDNRLIELAKKYNGTLCTIDFNLNKVASLEHIQVLNINEIAKQLRMNYLPGEKLSIHLVQKGNDGHQGVGYLEDGTMVVVENAKSDINTTIEVECIRSLQTAAGRMIFARKLSQPAGKPKNAAKSVTKSSGRRAQKPKSNEDRLIESIDSQS